ncbi:MAG: dihydroorotate dehydrogenase, partial [Ilumatobacteraceae bacterium]
GVATTADAIELMAVGASAVQIGTALFADPRVLARVRDGLVTEAARRGLGSVAEFTGLAAL